MVGFNTTCDQTCDRTHLAQTQVLLSKCFCFEVFVFTCQLYSILFVKIRNEISNGDLNAANTGVFLTIISFVL